MIYVNIVHNKNIQIAIFLSYACTFIRDHGLDLDLEGYRFTCNTANISEQY